MREGASTNDETLRLGGDDAAAIRAAVDRIPRLSLLVYHRDGCGVLPLARNQPVTVGRGAPADLVVEDESVSRLHARFRFGGEVVTVQDLGSTNGLRLRDERVARAELRPGDSVQLGAVTAVVHLRTDPADPAPGLEGHDTFCERVGEEIARARYFDEPLSVALIRGESHVSGWRDAVTSNLRPVDRAALYSDETLELLLPRLSAEQASHAVAPVLSNARPSLRAGIATFPRAATTVHELVAACRRAARTAEAGAIAVAPHASDAHPASADAPTFQSAAMREVVELAERAAGASIPVLIMGETGTGKEVIARLIHDRGPRGDGPMVCVNCAAIPSQLVESTLFGHERGAFTGAAKASPGVFGSADGGTVLLDEVGELPPEAQAALLRVLETGAVTRVGSPRETQVDVRVLAATHRDLEAMCDAGRFRRDLLFRLNAMTLAVPPLRERPEDIEALARQFLRSCQETAASGLKEIAPDALAQLERHPWPGNVRELRNVIERAAVLSRGDTLTVGDLPQPLRRTPTPAAAGRDADVLAGDDDLKTRLRAYEARLITAALDRTGGNRTDASKLLKVPLRTLLDKMKRLGIDVPAR